MLVWLAQYWSTLGMIGLGLVSLLVLRSMVRGAPGAAETAPMHVRVAAEPEAGASRVARKRGRPAAAAIHRRRPLAPRRTFRVGERGPRRGRQHPAVLDRASDLTRRGKQHEDHEDNESRFAQGGHPRGQPRPGRRRRGPRPIGPRAGPPGAAAGGRAGRHRPAGAAADHRRVLPRRADAARPVPARHRAGRRPGAAACPAAGENRRHV